LANMSDRKLMMRDGVIIKNHSNNVV